MTATTVPYQPPPNGWRTFLIAWVTQSISVLGSALTFFALNIWVTQTLYPRPEQKPELAAALAAISIAFALPTIFGGPIAGAWADRHDRKRTMMAMDFASGLLSLLLAVLVITNSLQLPLLIVLLVISAILGSFHGAAFDASYAMIVPDDKLPRANGMMQTIWSLSGILSPAIAATIIALPALARQGGTTSGLAQLNDGTPLAMMIDALTFFLAAGALIFLFIPSPKRSDLKSVDGQSKKSIWADIKEGAVYIWRRRPLLWLLGTFAVANFLAGPLGVFQTLLLKFNLAADWSAHGFTFEAALALLATVSSAGGLIGGVLISAWGGLKSKRVYGVVVALIVSGAAQIVLGLSSLLYLTAAMLLISRAMIPIMNSHSQTIWQTQTPRELQGRVFSVRRLIAQFTWPLSTALAGWAGGRFDPGVVIAVLGAVLVVFCVGQLFNPYLMRVEDKAWLDAMAERQAAHTEVQA
ncbi:MAG TPA: MFS transporter, partial [Anaerolineae bacterium]